MTSAPDSSSALPRTVPRAATNLVVETYDAEDRTLLGIGHVGDLSVDGACLDSTQEFSEHDRLNLRFLVDAVRVLRVPATVVWRRAYAHVQRYGLRLRPDEATVRDALAAYIQSHTGRFVDRPAMSPEVPS